MKTVTANAHIDCIHEEQIQGQSRKISELETRADYKEDIIKELKTDMKEIKQDMKEIKEDINNFILKSVNDDTTLREIINKQDNRITALESAKAEQWKLFVGFGTVITIISFLLNNVIK